MPPASTAPNGLEDSSYPSRNIAFRAASAITSIIDNLTEHDQLKYCPAFLVYSIFSALIMHVYQARSTNPTVVAESKERLDKCMKAMKEVSKVWVVARMIYALFESVLGNKALEERLQKSTGRRHHSKKQHHNHQHHHHHHHHQRDASVAAADARNAEPIKRKFDEMEIAGHAGRPAPNMSYERSRPQTPATVPNNTQSNTVNMSAPGSTTPHLRQGVDTFMSGHTQTTTRPPTPFQPSLSVPVTPPDLFLVTRSSPPISQSLWENFQPGQLFPDDSGVSYLSPPSQHGNPTLDPQLTNQSVSLSRHSMGQHMQGQMQGASPMAMAGVQNTGMQQHGWPNQFDLDPNGPMGSGSSPEDTWSNCSADRIVPTTLNVEDWYVFIRTPPTLFAF